MTKENFLVLDTETANDIDCPLVYDVGFMVCDTTGDILEQHSYVLAETFLNKDLMNTAYYAEKIPKYEEQLKSGERIMRRCKTIKFILQDIIKQYDIKKMWAYNCRFDYKSLTNTQRYLTKSKYRYFYPKDLEFHDILKYSRTVLKDSKQYNEFCKDNNYLDTRGQNRHTAEIVYRFLFDENFDEKHMGLDDCIIEHKILQKMTEWEPDLDCRLW